LVPLAHAVAAGKTEFGVATYSSGAGRQRTPTKSVVRARLIYDCFSVLPGL